MKDMHLPEQICQRCMDDLEVAFKFRSNCESSNAILQSFIDSDRVNAAVDTSSIKKITPNICPKLMPSLVKKSDENELNPATADLLVKFEPNTNQQIDNKVEAAADDGELLLSDESDECYDSDEPILLHLHEINQDAVAAYGLEIVDPEYITGDHETLPPELLLKDDSFAGQQEYDDEPTTTQLNENQLIDATDDDDMNERFNLEMPSDHNEIDDGDKKGIWSPSSRSCQNIKVEYVDGVDEDFLDDDDVVGDTEVIHFQPVQSNKARQMSHKNTNKSHDGGGGGKGNNQKPMKECELCGNKYRYQHALDSHMRRHRNEKPYKCE